MYWSCQVLTGMCNVIVANVRCAAHGVAMTIMFVGSLFVIIKRGGLLLQNGSSMSYSLDLLLAVAISLPVFTLLIGLYVYGEYTEKYV